MHRVAPLLLVAALAAAGCLASTDDGSPASEAGMGVGPDAADAGDRVSFHLGSHWELLRDEPTYTEPRRLEAGNFYASWAQGRDQPTWRGPALEESLHVTGDAELTFWVEADPLVATTGPGEAGFPEYVVYFGTVESPVAYASLEGPDVKTRGEPVKVEASLPTPPGGLVLEEGAHPVAILAPVQAQDDRGPRLEFLLNSTSHPSRVTLDADPVELPEPDARDEDRFEGVLAGSAYAAGEGPARATHTLDVGADATRVSAQLGSAGVGVRDVDLALLGPDGDVVARSVTPHPTEGIVLHGPTIEEVGTGTWTVEVTNYGHAAVEYVVEANVATS